MWIKQVPVEYLTIKGRKIIVYRSDLVPKPPLAPYFKMVELYPFLKSLFLRGYKCVGYYAVPQSEWVTSVPGLAKSLGMKAIIGISKTKNLPSYVSKINPKNIYYVKPNIYGVNYAITKKHVESIGGFMIPMGLACPEVVEGMCKFLDKHPIPKADNLIVPVGSGVALSGIAIHSIHQKSKPTIYGICTRSGKSVEKIVKQFVHPDRTINRIHVIERDANKPKPKDSFRLAMHPYWDQNAYQWMKENLGKIKGSICFINLGSGG